MGLTFRKMEIASQSATWEDSGTGRCLMIPGPEVSSVASFVYSRTGSHFQAWREKNPSGTGHGYNDDVSG